MYSRELRQQYLEILRGRLTQKRFTHSLGVEKMAGQLAEEYGADREKAEIAGLLHDYAKYVPDDQMLAYAREFGIPLCPAYEEKPNLLHGPVAAKLLERDLGIHDPEILAAVKHHTTGTWGIGLLEQVIYLADLLEENRDFPGVEELRETLKQGPDEAMRQSLARELQFLTQQGRTVHPDTAAAYEWMKTKKEKKA